jgi:GNAT superfamily N-acetyltransferase
MSKCGSGKSSKGGGSKSSSKGVGSDVVAVRSERLATSNNADVTTLLRRALRNDDGTDRDLLAELPSFRTFERGGLSLAVEFYCGRELPRAHASACFAMAKAHMADDYEASGYGWDDDDKWAEITCKEARLLLVFDAADAARPLVGFANFRLTLQGECWNAMEGKPCLFLYDLQLAEAVRRCGVGRHVVVALEMMARRVRMSYLCAMLTATNSSGAAFFLSFKGWYDDTEAARQMDSADVADATFRVLSKLLDGAALREKQQTAEVQQLAMQLAAMGGAAPAKAEPEAAVADADATADADDSAPGEAEAEADAKSKGAKKKARQRARKAQESREGLEANETLSQEPTTRAADSSEAEPPSAPEPPVAAGEVPPTPPPVAAGLAEPPCTPPAKAKLTTLEAADVLLNSVLSEAATIHRQVQRARAESPDGISKQLFGAPPAAEDEADQVLRELCDMFEKQNGRAATQEEIQMWVQTIKEASADGTLAQAVC